MAQAPTVEKPARFPLVQVSNNRAASPTKDARMINAFGEKADDGEYWVYKRPGTSLQISGLGTGLGAFNWSSAIYSVSGTSLLRNGAVIGTVDGSNGTYRFDSCQGATPKLFFMNGVVAYTYSTGTGLVQVTDADYPSALVKGCAFLDGTMYVMDAQGHIYGSALNDPTNWDPLNVIVAQSASDIGQALVRHLSYIVAFKSRSINFFVDQGNAAGSPLQYYPPLTSAMGCASADSIQSIDDEIFWLSNNLSASLTIQRMSNGQVSKVSSKAVDRILESFNVLTAHSFYAKHGGHRFYGVTSTATNITLVYDIDEGLWYYWTDANGNYFPYFNTSYFVNTYPLLQNFSDGGLYSFNSTYTSDSGVVFPVDIYTPNADMNTRRKKAVASIEFVGDQQAGSTLAVSCSDDDFTTFSTPRTVDLSVPRPRLDKCGSFSRRAYHLHHQSDTPFHLKAMEMQIDIGTL